MQQWMKTYLQRLANPELDFNILLSKLNRIFRSYYTTDLSFGIRRRTFRAMARLKLRRKPPKAVKPAQASLFIYRLR